MEAPPDLRRRGLIAVAACLFLVGFSILFVDRPASTWSHAHLHGEHFWAWLTHLVDPLRILAVLGLIATGIAAVFFGWRPGRNGRTLLAACVAIPVSFEVKEQLKYLCGRTWPETWTDNNPSWIGTHSFGFHLWHGGEGWSSFPSGHTTQMAALAAVIWLGCPRLRWLSVTLVTLVAVGLVGADFHFVGDIVAGGFVGSACGIGMMALLRE